MKLLEGRSLTPGRAVPLERMSLQLRERDATATITPADMDGIEVNGWMLDDREPQAGIVYRVRSIQQAFGGKTPTVSLEHVINTLKDRILFGEVTPKTITGNSSAETCTAKQAVMYILAQQSDWMLGLFDYESVSNPYKFDGDSLYDALETVTNTLEDALWTFDMSVYPFRLNIVQHSAEVDSELRASRNLKTISRMVDMGDMFTRFYPIGRDDLHLGGEYVEKNTEIYGVISRTETDQSLGSEGELEAWAWEKLNAHAQPAVTISADGYELSRETGESLDALTIGRICRASLPEFNTEILERITEISYTDKIQQPTVVKITMANSRRDVTKIISDALKRSGRGGRTAARKDKEDLAWFEDTNDHVSMTAIGIIGVDAQGKPNWTRMSEFIADGEGLHAKVETQLGDATDRIATLEINEEQIRTDVAMANSTIYSTIEQTATSIRQEVSRRARVFVQLPDPALTPANNVREGDIWIKSIRIQTWNELGARSWSDSADFNWNQYAGSPQYVYTGTRWEAIGDQGAVVEYATRIEQTERNISLIARALGAVDPSAIASLDISAEAIQASVSTAKSELYSVIRQTATNIVHEVADNITGISSYVEQTASSFAQAVARKNKVWIQLTDPAASNTVIDGDIWIKTSGNDNVRPTWSELSAKSWTSQNQTNWREYYEGYWYARKNGVWELMSSQADIVEIGTKLEQDEQHIALIARDVDENHQELGARLEVTARQIRGEVHAAKSTIYSVAEQTATHILHAVVDENAGNFSTILQTSTSIAMAVKSAEDNMQAQIDVQKDRISLVVSGEGDDATVDAASIVAGINAQSGSFVKIQARNINLSGYVTATSLTTQWLSSMMANITGNITIGGNIYAGLSGSSYFQGTELRLVGASSSQGARVLGLTYNNMISAIKSASVSGNTLTLTRFDDSTLTFSRATSLSAGWDGSRKFTVSASPQGISRYTTLVSHVPNADASWNGKNGTLTLKATIDGGEETQTVGQVTVTYPGGGDTPGRIEIWKSDDSAQITGGSWPKSGSLSFYPWVEVGGTGYSGNTVTMTNPFTGKGNGWYCTIENLTTGGKRCRLTKEFSAGSSVPFDSGNSYTLYT